MKRLVKSKKIVVFFVVTILFVLSKPLISVYAVTNPVPDTGQIKSYTDVFGEDSDYNINPQSYTKLDAQGDALPNLALSWSMVRDNVTGLIWENKTDDGSIHDKDNTYDWEDSQSVFIAELNAEKFGGYNDWRLPTIKELVFIINGKNYNPTINMTYFPNTISGITSRYWSSKDCGVGYVGEIEYAWGVCFYDGHSMPVSAYDSYYTRAVHGEQQHSVFVDNRDGTVTDTSTGLMWQQETSIALEWERAIRYCENLSLGGYNDWRLPNKNELQSIVDYSNSFTTIDITIFPDTSRSNPNEGYWSSTVIPRETTYYVWSVEFYRGTLFGQKIRGSYNYTRAVRGGKLEPLPDNDTDDTITPIDSTDDVDATDDNDTITPVDSTDDTIKDTTNDLAPPSNGGGDGGGGCFVEIILH